MVENFGLEEGEVKFGWRVRKCEEFLRWKVEKSECESKSLSNVIVSDEEIIKCVKFVVRDNGCN